MYAFTRKKIVLLTLRYLYDALKNYILGGSCRFLSTVYSSGQGNHKPPAIYRYPKFYATPLPLRSWFEAVPLLGRQRVARNWLESEDPLAYSHIAAAAILRRLHGGIVCGLWHRAVMGLRHGTMQREKRKSWSSVNSWFMSWYWCDESAYVLLSGDVQLSVTIEAQLFSSQLN